MPKAEKIYIITRNGVVDGCAYTSMKGVSINTAIPERTLWRWFERIGSYSKNGVVVTEVDIIRIKGRGRF